MGFALSPELPVCQTRLRGRAVGLPIPVLSRFGAAPSAPVPAPRSPWLGEVFCSCRGFAARFGSESAPFPSSSRLSAPQLSPEVLRRAPSLTAR